MRSLRLCKTILFLALAFAPLTGAAGERPAPPSPARPDVLRPLPSQEVKGVLGERLDLWRKVRLWRVANDPFLLDGFATRPGRHPWQGEHVGKWLHAATLACEATGEAKLADALRRTVSRFVAAQLADGYLGTYAPESRFYNKADKGDPWTWDIWTHRYAIYGLLSYADFHADPSAVDASRKAADLLEKTLGPPSGDITRFGTRHGLSSAVLLESIVMLYQRTGDERHLAFAKHIVDCVERNPQLRLMAAMRAGEDVSAVGDGKAYQLMALLLGYLELYRSTNREEYLDTAVAAWENIRALHINVAGGPWSYQVETGTNHECFAPPQYFHPTNCVETCSTTTWIQLCLSLFDLTGEARYADAAEVALFNQLLGAQSANGNDWSYHSMLNMPNRGYSDAVTCCASSGPRALELYARHLVCDAGERLVVNSYVPATVPLAGPTGRRGRVIVEGGYPFLPQATLRIELPNPESLTVDFRLPAGANDLELQVNGAVQQLQKTREGLFRLRRVWSPQDQVSLRFDWPLHAHFQTASDGVRWVAFSWGPLVLAQTVLAQTDHPENVLAVPCESEDGTLWVERAVAPARRPQPSDNAAEDGSLGQKEAADSSTLAPPAWRLKVPRKITFVPYFLAGGEQGGVRTMFPTRSE